MTDMIHEGTDLKFRVTASLAGFTMDADDFAVTVRSRFGLVVLKATRSQMLRDSAGGWVFLLPRVRWGTYYACFDAHRPDGDFPDGVQHVTDTRLLCTVGRCHDGGPLPACCPADGLEVAYERVWAVSSATGPYLTDGDGAPILDADGQKIYLLPQPESADSHVRLGMTGDEFKRLIEGRDANGSIDTVPEVLDALGGVSDDTQVAVTTEADIDSMMGRVLGRLAAEGQQDQQHS